NLQDSLQNNDKNIDIVSIYLATCVDFVINDVLQNHQDLLVQSDNLKDANYNELTLHMSAMTITFLELGIKNSWLSGGNTYQKNLTSDTNVYPLVIFHNNSTTYLLGFDKQSKRVYNLPADAELVRQNYNQQGINGIEPILEQFSISLTTAEL